MTKALVLRAFFASAFFPASDYHIHISADVPPPGYRNLYYLSVEIQKHIKAVSSDFFVRDIGVLMI
jgi:hypothetical protein